MNNLKMYIILHNDVPDDWAPNCAAHASLSCFKTFEDRPEMQEWMDKSFKKVTCRAPDHIFQKAKEVGDCVVINESDLPGNPEVAIAFCPREEWPKMFRFLALWKTGRLNEDGSRRNDGGNTPERIAEQIEWLEEVKRKREENEAMAACQEERE